MNVYGIQKTRPAGVFDHFGGEMNSRHWNTCKDPLAMLALLERELILTERKCRLAMIAMCRHFQQRFTDPRHAKLITRAEEAVETGYPVSDKSVTFDYSIVHQALRHIDSKDAKDAILGMCLTCRNYRLLELSTTADIFRDIWWNPYEMNPFRETSPSHTSIAMADEAYHERATNGVMNRDVLAILADSLETDGIESPVIRQHLTRVKPHYRGDWAIDTLLGKS